MGYNIGPTIAVKGESEFNSTMAKIKTNMKLISSEAGVMSAQFKGNENSIQALTAKDKLLNEALKEQKRAVKESEDALRRMKEAGVDETSKAFIEMETNLNTSKAALIATEREIKDTNEALKHGGRSTRDFSKDLHSFAQAAGKVALGAAKAFAIGIAALATAAVFAAKKVFDLTVNAGNWADEVLTMSNQTDLSVRTLQELAYAARFVDVDVETMTKGMGRVVAQMREATNKGKDFIEVTGGLKVSMVDANGELKTTEQMFYDTIDALGSMTNATERDIAAQEIFGKSYQEIKPLIDAGSQSLLLYAAEAKKAGIILGDEAVEKLGKFDDQMERTTAKLETAGRLAAVNFLPAIDGIVSGVSEILSTITTAFADGFQDGDITTISDAITKQIQTAMDGVAKNAPAFIGVVTKVLSSLIGMIVELIPTLLPVLVSSLTQLLTGLFQTVNENADAISQAVVEIVTMMAMFLIENLPLLIETGLSIVIALMQGIGEALPEMIPAIVNMVLEIVRILTNPDTVVALNNAALQIILAVAQGLIQAIPQLIAAIPEIITNIVMAFAQAAPQMWAAAKQLIEMLIQGIKLVMNKILDIGVQIVKGIWQGISNSFEWIKKKITEWVGDIVAFFKKLLGINSPSTVFASMGEMSGAGYAKGILGSIGMVRGAITKMKTAAVETIGDGIFAALNNTMGAVGGVTLNVGARSGQSAGSVSGGVSIGQIIFNQPVESPVQTVNLIERQIAGVLYAH